MHIGTLTLLTSDAWTAQEAKIYWLCSQSCPIVTTNNHSQERSSSQSCHVAFCCINISQSQIRHNSTAAPSSTSYTTSDVARNAQLSLKGSPSNAHKHRTQKHTQLWAFIFLIPKRQKKESQDGSLGIITVYACIKQESILLLPSWHTGFDHYISCNQRNIGSTEVGYF